jgi:hypothetical protein
LLFLDPGQDLAQALVLDDGGMTDALGSILGGPLAALLREQTGSWLPVFAIIIAMDALTGILALAILKPMRRDYAGAGYHA